MTIEITIYLFVACVLNAYRRVLSGKKNGCFYGKNVNPPAPELEKSIKNLHYIETPAWYSQFGALFFFAFAIFRLLHPETDLILREFLAAMLVTMGSSGMANYYYQGYINDGSGLPWLDPNENPKSEFAFGPIRFWWWRPWCGRARKYVPFFGAASVVTGIWLGIN